MAAEFKIGRLRFTWGGAWASGTQYSRDTVIQYNGKAYACLIAHTANANFSLDLNAVPYPYWQLLIDGKTWKGPWTTGTVYALGNIVIVGGAAYTCTTAHTSTTFAADAANWATYDQFAGWNPTWSPSTAYSINSLVKYGGIVYKCTTNHTSAATTALGLEADISKWTIYFNGIEYTGAWTASTRYKLNDLVKISGNIYICTTYNSDATFVPSKWNTFLPGQSFKLIWANTTTYQIGDAVVYGGDAYVSKTANNVGNIPSSDTTNWSIFNQGYNIRGDWSNSTSYQLGDVVRRNGMLYEAIIDNTAYDPSNFTVSGAVNTLAFTYVSGQTLTGVGYGAELDVSVVPGTPGYTLALSQAFTISNPILTNTTSVFTCDALANPLPLGQPVTITGTFSSGFITGYSSPTTYYVIASTKTSFQLSTVVSGSAVSSTPSTGVITGITIVPSVGGGGYAQNDTFKILGTQLGGTTPTNDLLVTVTSVTSGAVATVTPTSGTPISSSDKNLVVSNVTGVVPGMVVESQGITFGQTVVAVTGNLVTLDALPNKTVNSGDIVLFNGVNSTYWTTLIPGIKWSGRWATGTQYIIGDVVVWSNGTYRCIQNHTSAGATRPDQTPSNANIIWILLASHVKNNTLAMLGDMETFNVNKYQEVIIGAQGQVLRDTANLPTWSQINSVPSVYYVSASNGVDRVDYGRSWDTPFQTIAYACNFVGKGLYNQNAASLIESNRSWLITEMYQWMRYQMANSQSPFSPTSLWDPYYTQRDAGYVIDAIAYDLRRGGNSQTVAAVLRYFTFETAQSPGILINSLTAAVLTYITASLGQLVSLMQNAITNTAPAQSYQTLNSISGAAFVYQTIDLTLTAEAGAGTLVTNLMGIITTALTNQNTTTVPASNAGLTAVVNIKTGTYNEILPISVPENVSLVGDELRSVQVQPATSISMVCSQTYNATTPATANRVVVNSTTGLVDQMPVQFISPYVNNAPTTFGAVVSGQTYYVVGSTILPTSFKIQTSPTVTFTGTTTLNSTTISNVTKITNLTVGATITGPGIIAGTTIVSVAQTTNEICSVVVSNPATASYIAASFTATGNIVSLTNGTGTMTMYAGDCLKDMFYMRNGTTMRNLTLNGLVGTLTQADSYGIARPTGGKYTSLDPGNGPGDTSAWIFRKSPYVQNVTTFGVGCVGMKIDGSLHTGGNKSMVANDYTQVLSDGVGVWCTGSGSLTECVSVFSYYNYMSYFAELGGRIRATNGNSSYGVLGAVSEGYDVNETPITGSIYNQSAQVQAQVQDSFGLKSQLLKLLFSNAGSAYYNPATNLLKYSNSFLDSGWSSDGNITFIKNEVAPTGYTEGWLLTGTKSTPGTGYVYQNITINPSGYAYTNLTGTNLSGSGNGATFNVTVTSAGYVVAINSAGSLYAVTNQIVINGSQLGGLTGVNDLTITVASLSGSGILTITSAGTIPAGSDQYYTLSMYVYPGTSQTVDLQGIFSGTSTLTSGVTYNVTSNVVTPYSSGGGMTPTKYGAQKTLVPGWYRVWMAINDVSGVNTNLQYRFFPQGASNPIANTYSLVYAAQTEISLSTYSPNFYLETTNTRYSSFANFEVVGAGTGALLVAEESRSNGVFNARITADSNSVTGGSGYVTATNNAQAGNDLQIQLAQSEQGLSNFIGMRVFITSGTGSGQYGYVATYDNSTKIAQILQESVDALPITQSNSSGNLLSIATGTDLSKIYVNQRVQFTPTYYTTTVAQSSTATIQVTSTLGGAVNYLYVTSTAALAINMPVTFSGTVFSTINAGYTYFISNIVDATTIQISSQIYGAVWQLSSGSGSMTMSYPSYQGYLTATTTANMSPTIPIQFSGSAIGNVTLGQTYYIQDIIDGTNFTVSALRVTGTVTATSAVNNGCAITSTASLVPLSPVVFGGTIFDINITAGAKYYISNIIDSGTFNIAASILTVTCTKTELTSNFITCTSTTGFVPGQPIRFTGLVMGNVQSETLYYILSVSNGTQFTISATSNGQAVTLFTATGAMQARTCPAPTVLSGGSGSMTIASTGNKVLTTNAFTGSMNATFSTAVFGGLSATQVYYITGINTGTVPNTITVSTTQGGGAATLLNAVGTMNMGAAGWDNINPGTTISPSLDSTTQYYIEPRVTFSEPAFSTANSVSVVVLSPSNSWQAIIWGGNYFVAIPNGGSTGAYSADGTSWTGMTMPTTASWSSVTFGNSYYVAVSSGGQAAAYSNNGVGWRPSTLPSTSTWSSVTYGNGTFVAIATSTNKAAYSTDFGRTWSASTLSSTSAWVGLDFGGGIFVAIAASGVTSYSVDGITWQAGALPSGTAYSALTYGNNRFVAIQNASNVYAAFSFDGINWSQSNTYMSGTLLTYGQGVFLAVQASSTQAYTSDSGLYWVSRTVPAPAYSALGFGFSAARVGVFTALAGQATGITISAGVRAQGRPSVSSGVVTAVNIWEPGSNYQTTPVASFTDFNAAVYALVTPRYGNGTLGNPTFVNRGLGYNTTSTAITITGNGYADVYQTGYTLIINNLNSLPIVGSNLTVAGNTQVYKVTSATAVYGTTAPFIQANVQISPTMTNALSPSNGAQVSIRQLYSQCRLTNHDFLAVGVGNAINSNYPNVNSSNITANNQTVEANQGRIFYTSTDQDGNFNVGGLFGVQQATGTVTLSATQFGLSGLNTLSLGGIALGGQSVVVTQFGTDGTFAANSDAVVPTQRAIKTYLTARLSQGGANTFTGQLTAGSVVVGGANFIRSTIPNGQAGSSIVWTGSVPSASQTRAYFRGANGFSTVDGNLVALDYFMWNGNHR